MPARAKSARAPSSPGRELADVKVQLHAPCRTQCSVAGIGPRAAYLPWAHRPLARDAWFAAAALSLLTVCVALPLYVAFHGGGYVLVVTDAFFALDALLQLSHFARLVLDLPSASRGDARWPLARATMLRMAARDLAFALPGCAVVGGTLYRSVHSRAGLVSLLRLARLGNAAQYEAVLRGALLRRRVHVDRHALAHLTPLNM